MCVTFARGNTLYDACRRRSSRDQEESILGTGKEKRKTKKKKNKRVSKIGKKRSQREKAIV